MIFQVLELMSSWNIMEMSPILIHSKLVVLVHLKEILAHLHDLPSAHTQTHQLILSVNLQNINFL